jgi:hypothetical protein
MKLEVEISGIEPNVQKPTYLWSTAFWQGCQDHSMGNESSFQQMLLGQLDCNMLKIMNLDAYLTLYTEIYSQT